MNMLCEARKGGEAHHKEYSQQRQSFPLCLAYLVVAYLQFVHCVSDVTIELLSVFFFFLFLFFLFSPSIFSLREKIEQVTR